jgi:hypothetical protein
MVKRMIMDLGAVPPILRISRPGVAVTTSTPGLDLLLDERVLYGQIFITGLATRLDVGDDETLVVPIVSQGFIPFINCWQLVGSDIVYPTDSVDDDNVNYFWFSQTATQISFNFQAGSSVTAVYYQIMRMPRS